MLFQVIREFVEASRRKRVTVASGSRQTESSNPLADYFYHNPGRGTCKWHHYFEIYHRHFARFQGKAPIIVEIGVAFGGSLQMWHHYFGPGTYVVGIDNDPACRQFEDDATKIIIGDQADRSFLATVRDRVPRIDILIDDGGHRMEQQIATFEELYPHVQQDGVYLCEDLQTSLWPNFGGGYARKDTFLEYSKALVDRLLSWHSLDSAALRVDDFTSTTHGMHFYDGVLVIEKRRMEPPRQFMTYGSAPPGSDANAPRFRP
jgi:cephalosporin hydroxylase